MCARSLCDAVLKAVAKAFQGPKRELPAKVFRMYDVSRSGCLSKKETLRALRGLGLGNYAGHGATMEKHRKFEQAWAKCDRAGVGEVTLEEFRLLLSTLLPDEDWTHMLKDALMRGHIALASFGLFVLFVFLTTLGFVYLKRLEEWTVLDSFYFTVITFTTIGIGDLAPSPHPASYMVAWCAFTMFGLGFTTAMITALSDEHVSLRDTLRGCLPAATASAEAMARRAESAKASATGGARKVKRRMSCAMGRVSGSVSGAGPPKGGKPARTTATVPVPPQKAEPPLEPAIMPRQSFARSETGDFWGRRSSVGGGASPSLGSSAPPTVSAALATTAKAPSPAAATNGEEEEEESLTAMLSHRLSCISSSLLGGTSEAVPSHVPSMAMIHESEDPTIGDGDGRVAKPLEDPRTPTKPSAAAGAAREGGARRGSVEAPKAGAPRRVHGGPHGAARAGTSADQDAAGPIQPRLSSSAGDENMAGFWGRRPSRASARMPGSGAEKSAAERSSTRPVAEALAMEELRRSCRLSSAGLAQACRLSSAGNASLGDDDDDDDDDKGDAQEDGNSGSHLSHATLERPRGPAGVDVRRRASLGRVEDVKTRRASVDGLVPLPEADAKHLDDDDVAA